MGFPQGPFYIDDTYTFTALTTDAATGALVDADAVPAYRVYEDETGTAILTGNMAKLDDAGTLGFYSEQLTLSAANGFEVGKSYNIYVSATIDSVVGGTTGSLKVIAATYPANVTHVNGAAQTATLDTIKAETAAILTDTAEIGAAGVGLTEAGGTGDHLTAINLPNQTMDIVGNITGNLSGSVGSVTGAVGSVTAGVTLANDAITAAKFDESTAFPLTSADTGSSAVARTGADGDTLETLSDEIAAVKAETALIVADTGELQGDWVNGGRLDNILDARASQTSVDELPTNAELTTALGTADDAVLAALATVDGNVDDIKTKTDSLTFGVSGKVDANITHVNETEVAGVGSEASPWGPV